MLHIVRLMQYSGDHKNPKGHPITVQGLRSYHCTNLDPVAVHGLRSYGLRSYYMDLDHITIDVLDHLFAL